MHIVEIIDRIKNDYRFVALCKFCQRTSHHGDGYADYYYAAKVFPARPCPHCGGSLRSVSVDNRIADV